MLPRRFRQFPACHGPVRRDAQRARTRSTRSRPAHLCEIRSSRRKFLSHRWVQMFRAIRPAIRPRGPSPGAHELLVGQHARGVQLREMLDLVRRGCGRGRIRVIVDRRLIDRRLVGLVLRLPFGPVISDCAARYRSNKESSTSRPSPHTDANSLLLLAGRNGSAQPSVSRWEVSDTSGAREVR